tara:strand:- start:827 stop:1249 length:423 start_codon:yes stop_codon:yes gene_type:complete
MSEINSLAKQLVAAQRKKKEIEECIKGLKKKILDTEEASLALTPLSNEGGSDTQNGITFSIPRTHIWDQETLDEILELIPREEWPPFVRQITEYKVDNTVWNKWALANPGLAEPFHRAHSIQLGDRSITKIDIDKLNKED